ncbi:hypothetical protein BGX21_000661 [Mortierella sp. AD011]|nr:hypothetical protein BGX21_000661 [Mortierella sp. AD011]
MGAQSRAQVDRDSDLLPMAGGPEAELGIVQRLLEDTVRLVIELDENGHEIGQDLQKDFERWETLIPKFSDILRSRHGSSGTLKRQRAEESPSVSLAERVQMRQQEDLASVKKVESSRARALEYTLSTKPLNDHQKAFVQICSTVRRYQDLPESPSCFITRLTSDISTFSLDQNEVFKGHIMWIESRIQNQSVGWRSCVKLKLQFFAVFEESAINEDFANLICECDLHWELCSVLSRYLKRHRADATRLPFETFQLGCELLLSVFSKKEQIRCQLRDHLYFISRSICQDTKAPLFGSWGFWMIDIETELVATLNQLVATKTTAKSFAVPPHTIESLVKISLIAPYQVVAKIVGNAMVNRGQSAILLEVLVNLGQLPWLRTDPTEKNLLVAVIHDIMFSEHKSEETLSDQKNQHRNFVEFILKAFVKKSPINQVALDATDFLKECVEPLIDTMVKGTETSFFSPVVAILMKLHQPEFGASVIDEEWLSQDIHLKILLQLLLLRTVKSSWTASQICDHAKPRTTIRQLPRDKQGDFVGDSLEDISKLSELLVSRLSAHVGSMALRDGSSYEGIDNFLQAIGEQDGSIDLESHLIAAPFIIACQQHLHSNVQLPALPKEIWPLCRNYLKLFSLRQPTREHTRGVDLLQALLIVLDMGRMCDDIMLDITQAIGQVKDLSLVDQGHLMQALIPLLYRVFSISSRSEGHRLLTRGIPAMMKYWGDLPDLAFYWNLADEKPRKRLGSYWDAFNLCKFYTAEREESQQEQESWGGFSSEEVVVAVLMTSEMLLRFALEPLTPKSPSIVLQIYRMFVGYDMMVDHMASLVLSSIKFVKVDWSTAPLDFVLFCFMIVCRLSNIVSNEHMNKSLKNRFGHTSLDPTLLAATENGDWTSVYSNFMSQQCDKIEQQELVARSKARDELVLVAMNLSEEIVRRQDNYYKPEDESMDSILESNVGTDKNGPATQSKGKKRGNKGNKRGRGGKTKCPLESRDSYRDDDNASLNIVTASNVMDEGTRAWFNSIMSASNGSAMQGSPKPDTDATLNAAPSDSQQHQNQFSQPPISPTAPSTPEPALPDHDVDPSIPIVVSTEAAVPIDSIDLENNDNSITLSSASETVNPMLSSDQIDCLTLALDYLPTQERLAVGSRLSKLLKAADENNLPGSGSSIL